MFADLVDYLIDLFIFSISRAQLSVEPQVWELQEPTATMENVGTFENPSVSSPSTGSFHR